VSVLLPFRAIRPAPGLAPTVAAPPYDVVDVAEARALAQGKPESFLHVSRPEIDLPDDVDPHSPQVYERGRRNLEELLTSGVLRQDAEPSFLVYRQRQGETVQTGIVGCASVADYRDGTIATHEHTRPDKEDDRVDHIDALGAHDEPVFLMFREEGAAVETIADVVAAATAGEPIEDFQTPDGVAHTLWRVASGAPTATLIDAFSGVRRLYVADGHHRSAAAARVADRRGETGESGLFLIVTFPASQLNVLPYNRVVADLAGRTSEEFRAALEETFELEPASEPVAPAVERHVGIYLDGQWLSAIVRPELVDESDPVARLDIAVLQDRVLGPLLGITDVRTDQRIAFVGGSRGTVELERLVDSGRFAVAFSMCATTTTAVMDVADEGKVMPPKSTWFEPKLASGLFLHAFDLTVPEVERPVS
jgi:uncharacterized protein (DUF1015 family)